MSMDTMTILHAEEFDVMFLSWIIHMVMIVSGGSVEHEQNECRIRLESSMYARLRDED